MPRCAPCSAKDSAASDSPTRFVILLGDSTYLAEFLGSLTGSIVLVGHSYGGNVISMAAAGNDQVQALVYFNGWMCDEGESQQQLLERFEGSLVGPAVRPVPYTAPDGSEGADGRE